MIFLPIFYSMTRRVKLPEKSMEIHDIRLTRLLSTMSSWTFGKGRYIVLSVATFVLLLSVISSGFLKYGDTNPGSPILWPDSEYNVDIEKTNARFPGVDQMWLVIETKKQRILGESDLFRPDVQRGMEKLKQHMIDDPNVGYAVSMADLIKGVNRLIRGNDPKMETIPGDETSIAQLVNVYSFGTSAGEMDQWMDSYLNAANVRIFLRDHKGDTLDKVIKRVTDFVDNNPNLMESAVVKPAGGLGGILAAANGVIAVKNHQLLIMVLGCVFILCSLTYRSMLAGLIYTSSLILANFLAFAYMVFKDIGMNINTLPVVALGIGLGVDYGLYIVSRIRDANQEEKDLGRAVVRGVTTAGRAVFFTATMMTAGVVFWYFSPLRFQAEMGFLLGILMMANMLVGIVVLPAIINIIKPKFIMREGI